MIYSTRVFSKAEFYEGIEDTVRNEYAARSAKRDRIRARVATIRKMYANPLALALDTDRDPDEKITVSIEDVFDLYFMGYSAREEDEDAILTDIERFTPYAVREWEQNKHFLPTDYSELEAVLKKNERTAE